MNMTTHRTSPNPMPISAARRTSVCIRNHCMKRTIWRDTEDIAPLIPSSTGTDTPALGRTTRQIDVAAGLALGCVATLELRAVTILTPGRAGNWSDSWHFSRPIRQVRNPIAQVDKPRECALQRKSAPEMDQFSPLSRTIE